MAGDTLARGGRTATFGPAKVSAEKWARIWDDWKPSDELTSTDKKATQVTNGEQSEPKSDSSNNDSNVL